MAKRQFKKAYSVKRKKSVLKKKNFRVGILSVILAVGVVYVLFFSPIFKIKNIAISGNVSILSASIENKISGQMLDKCKDNVFLCSPAKMEAALSADFPKISSVKIGRSLPGGLNVSIEEREPVAIFCQQENCFDIDKNGIIFENASSSSTSTTATSTGSLPEIENQTLNSQARLGDNAVNSNVMSQILQIYDKMQNDFQIPVESFSIISQQRLNVTTVESWQAYFNLAGDLNWQLTELHAVLNEKLPSPQSRQGLQYIDLRFDKVFIYPAVN